MATVAPAPTYLLVCRASQGPTYIRMPSPRGGIGKPVLALGGGKPLAQCSGAGTQQDIALHVHPTPVGAQKVHQILPVGLRAGPAGDDIPAPDGVSPSQTSTGGLGKGSGGDRAVVGGEEAGVRG